MKILWYSQHSPIYPQLKELKRMFGDFELTHNSNTIDDVTKLIKSAVNYDEIVIVAPLSVIQKLTGLGIKPLWADMIEVTPDLADVIITKSRGGITTKVCYKFLCFKRIAGINIIYENVM